ncbi:hypothetical protein [Yellowstone lake phycodnavirus 2]|jgi:hypothetical protein|uniref:hypothetical protein n=1 Tax=Yellowstone lake phycodnavirus 2 TaxID=1586714 RepID=UPI0006EB81B5|nr:hypothetical protein AR678_gp037 [Yellowstone lake phycodnavirus 2]BAT22311.1 hypothetical protein [Yellowstone lake phycodnavirus 2]
MDPSEIFRTDQLLNFWPTGTQSAKERTASTVRFVLYASVIVYLINRDNRVFALAGLVLAILYYLYTSNMMTDGKIRATLGNGRVAGPIRDSVTMPSLDNPMGNVLMTDYVDQPDRPSAAWYPSVRTEVQNEWSKIHPFERKRDAERNFYTMPVTTIPNDQAGFAQASFGKPFSPMCKDQGGASCDIDNDRFHFPERTQMRAGNGR